MAGVARNGRGKAPGIWSVRGPRNDKGCAVGRRPPLTRCRTFTAIILALVFFWSFVKIILNFPSSQILFCASPSSMSNCSSIYSDEAVFPQQDQGSCLSLDMEGGTKPRLFLHVGPGKMGTTTIQQAIHQDRNTTEFVLDNFCPLVDNNATHRWAVKMNRASFNMTEEELVQGHTFVEASLQKCLEKGYDVALSSEFLGSVSKEQYQRVFEPIFGNFDLIVVVGYRRFYDWVPSVYFQILKGQSDEFTKWPAKNIHGEPNLRSWVKQNLDTTLRALYTDNYIENWLNNNSTKNIVIYNLHEDENVLKTFYCRILCARNLCKMRSAEPPPNKNIGYSTAYDSIAVTAFVQGKIPPNSVSRKKAAKHVENYFSQINMTTLDLLKTCFAESELEHLLNETKRMESTLLPEFYLSKKGQSKMEKEFQKLKETTYCTVATNQILQQHNFRWEQFVP